MDPITSPFRGRKRKRLTRHHIFPRSRGGNGDKGNVIKLPDWYHQTWHDLFGNLTAEEAIKFIAIVFRGKGLKRFKPIWTFEELCALRVEIQQKNGKRRPYPPAPK